MEPLIDELYKLSLGDFIAQRAALAKTLKGADAQRVKRLQKPLLVPWVVNQVYWHKRPAYERLEQAGKHLRAAQVAALGGRDADVRAATLSHREALTAAVEEGMRLASAVGARPSGDQLATTLEALSLATRHQEVPGRLTKPLTPAGFEALGGIAVKAPAAAPTRLAHFPVSPSIGKASRLSEKTREKQIALERRKQAALAKTHAAALRKSEGVVARARSAEAAAREKWEQAKRHLDSTERALKSLREH